MKKPFVFISLLLFSAGCVSTFPTPSPTPAIGDGGLISNNPCGPPCFYGITPGLTTEKEVDEVTNKYVNIFSNCEPYHLKIRENHRGLICDDVALTYIFDTVDRLSYEPGISIVLDDVINSIGPPDIVSSSINSLPDKPFYSDAILFYDEKHMILIIPDQSGTEITLAPDTQVIRVTYLYESNYEKLKTLSTLFSTPWRGYGIYEAKLPTFLNQ
jgi:hypothetical protein